MRLVGDLLYMSGADDILVVEENDWFLMHVKTRNRLFRSAVKQLRVMDVFYVRQIQSYNFNILRR